MLFNSFEFLIFFPIVTVLYFLLPHRFRWIHLLAASCYFYMAFVPAYILILFATIIIDYIGGILIERFDGRKRKWTLIITIASNIAVLCVFKYYDFFVGNVNELLATVGYKTEPFPYLQMVLPIGLSFHTFQALSYIIEIGRGNFKAEKHFGIYSLYVMFYPQLVAGPIERPQNLLHQFHERKYFTSENLIVGVKLILWGLFKKIVIADRLAIYVNNVYDKADTVESYHLWLAAFVFFPLQVYCDFSGYSTIAVGTARVMGFKLMENFNRPFASVTTSELWNRWHISLSTWFRDYVYQPLVINFRDWGKVTVPFALLITFMLSGLWHGAGWNFIFYGLFQGLVISSEFLLGIKAAKLRKTSAGRLKGMVVTYFLFAFSLIFFRSENVQQAFTVIKRLFALPQAGPDVTISFSTLAYVLSLTSILFVLYFEKSRSQKLLYDSRSLRTDIVFSSAMVVLMLSLGIFHNLSFIYFQF